MISNSYDLNQRLLKMFQCYCKGSAPSATLDVERQVKLCLITRRRHVQSILKVDIWNFNAKCETFYFIKPTDRGQLSEVCAGFHSIHWTLSLSFTFSLTQLEIEQLVLRCGAEILRSFGSNCLSSCQWRGVPCNLATLDLVHLNSWKKLSYWGCIVQSLINILHEFKWSKCNVARLLMPPLLHA